MSIAKFVNEAIQSLVIILPISIAILFIIRIITDDHKAFNGCIEGKNVGVNELSLKCKDIQVNELNHNLEINGWHVIYFVLQCACTVTQYLPTLNVCVFLNIAAASLT